LNVEFIFIEEPDKKNAALQSGGADFIWTTTDEMPINLPGFDKANVEVQSFIQIDWSRGGDACVADKAVTKPRDLLTRKGAVLKYSPDHTVLEYWLTNSDLTPDELTKVRTNIAFSMDDYTFARNLFCQGKIDVACLWEPDVSLAIACRPGAYRVFSTKDANTLVADNLLVRNDFKAAHPDVVEKIARIFLEGGKIGNADKKAAAKLISTVEPRFRDELKYEVTLASLDWVKWNDLGDNVAYFGLDDGSAKFDAVYKQADSIWAEYTEPDGSPALSARFTAPKLRDGSIIQAIYDDEKKARAVEATAKGVAPAPIEVEKPVYKPEAIAKAEPKMTKPVTINFDTGETELDVGARAILKAQVLTQTGLAEAMGIRVEGNTDDTGSAAVNKALSAKRAAAVKDFLVSQGLDPNRVVAVGNGPDNPTCNAKTADCRAANRRTDIVFVTVQ
jgi:outer membrane protein OmpA-like peptidoglycan-associated protein